MLKKLFALSDTGAKNLKLGIISSAFYNLLVMFPVGLLMMALGDILEAIKSGKQPMQGKTLFYIAATIILFLLIFLAQWIQYRQTYTASYKESSKRRIALAEKMKKLPLSFFAKKDLANLTTTIMGDCTSLEMTFSNAIPTLFGTLIMFLVISISLIVMDYRMGLCILLPAFLAAIVLFAARKGQQKADLRCANAKRKAYDGVQEFLDNIQEIKSSSRQEEYLIGLENKLEDVVKLSFKNELLPGSVLAASQFILRLGLVAVLITGGILVSKGSLSLMMFLLFLLIAGRIYDPFSSVFMLLAEIFSAMVSIKRMKEIEKTPEQRGQKSCPNKGYDIVFDNVRFKYSKDEDKNVLDGVSFRACQGEVTALVGPSGCGKSTVSKLAARFWDVDSGKITLGGADISKIEPETLFKNFAIVFQDVMLFDESVMENIRLGRKDATDEEVIAAAKAALCEEFIQRLPDGYNTNIGENGSFLSGGERQRISIARALLKNAPVILLDEATASMDAESETLVQEALSTLLSGKTVLVIAHRMRTVARANKVIFLKDGKVAETGTPQKLLQKNGLFAALYKAQGLKN
ncbi:ATP-binding cassette, subfamily B [Acetitomaculum ruminis DSM 5522]|uniref:ATP-binding cassette, subfamily B n=1 Tax=Acetitomaculum ruminis DSM 5522 TaxID=1120918 RepID=A0A1I0X880_9FIRM|nr:ABC transporter ATP-binding protein [Acetitomaculum ruminis]SFA97121.1 ATP-binding cassette, subfamily B [Acetitomaculum ruminis DSM 5522]